MTRFFFDTSEGGKVERDTEGVDLPDEASARAEAKAALTDMARDHLPNGNHMGFRVTVRNEAGHEIYSARLVMDAGPSPAGDGSAERLPQPPSDMVKGGSTSGGSGET